MLRVIEFRVQNFRNVDDTGWIPLERVTAFVGRNESGKTAILKALHKFNPAIEEPYDPQREFPRDRYTRDYNDPSEWPVCSVRFEIASPLLDEFAKIFGQPLEYLTATCTRYYDGSLETRFDPAIENPTLGNKELLTGLKEFAKSARRIKAESSEHEPEIQALRTQLAQWASDWQEKVSAIDDFRSDEGLRFLKELKTNSESHSRPETATIVESLQEIVQDILILAERTPPTEEAETLVLENLPVFVYFENYGILDSAIYLPRFLEDLRREPNEPRIRTINAMFKHVNLEAQEIEELGKELADDLTRQNQTPDAETIRQDQQRKEARAIKLNAASIDITARFNQWYGQRRHVIDYDADGDYFRIWVADDRRPGVRIELESRSKGFQWFFSFYLVFLVESEEGHKDAVVLLDEPGLHLHPTAQQELIGFFEQLSEQNQLVYTTHSPFLIDGDNLQRIRPVVEDATGHSSVSTEVWPSDHETIFPLQAAAGYAMVRGLFQHAKNVLVEGISDYYYLHGLNSMCRVSGRTSLPDDIYITPCGGTKNVGYIASLFLGQKVRPLVLLDGDEAGRARRDTLLKELYAAHDSAVAMLDEVVNRSGKKTEIEDLLGADVLCPALSTVVGTKVTLSKADRSVDSVVDQIRNWAERRKVELPVDWKVQVASLLVSEWAEKRTKLEDRVLDEAEILFASISARMP